MMRTVSHQFFNHSLNHGPFTFCLTDLHASNIFVDKNWNIECLIDLEWAASLPVEFLQTPFWLTGQAVDKIEEDSYNLLPEEFMQVFEEEEDKQSYTHQSGLRYSSIMKEGWETGTFWYTLALQSPIALHALFYNHIQPY